MTTDKSEDEPAQLNDGNSEMIVDWLGDHPATEC